MIYMYLCYSALSARITGFEKKRGLANLKVPLQVVLIAAQFKDAVYNISLLST